jgi:MSHA biogenesis protein MshP
MIASETMNARRSMTGPKDASGEKGFGMFAAIAILVILAVLGAFVVSVTGLRSQSTAVDVLGSRALLAARAGIEWSMYLIQNPENTNPAVAPFTTPYSCPGLGTNLNFGGALSDFTVTVQPCTTTTATEAGNTVRIYQIVVVACNFPAGGACPNNASTSPSYVERQITVLTETCRLPSGASC